MGTPNFFSLANQHIYWSYCSEQTQDLTETGPRLLRHDSGERKKKWMQIYVSVHVWIFLENDSFTCTQRIWHAVKCYLRSSVDNQDASARDWLSMNLDFLIREMQMVWGLNKIAYKIIYCGAWHMVGHQYMLAITRKEAEKKKKRHWCKEFFSHFVSTRFSGAPRTAAWSKWDRIWPLKTKKALNWENQWVLDQS